MKYKKITIEVEEDDGKFTERILDFEESGQKILRCSLSTGFNLENSSETITIQIERITSQSIEWAERVKNPFWR